SDSVGGTVLTEEDELPTTDVFPDPGFPEVSVVRPSIARSAKAKPKIPEEFRKLPVSSPVHKRERSPPSVALPSPTAGPPAKKRRTQKSVVKARADSLALAPEGPSSKDEEPFRIQEGEPDYFTGNDTRTSGHASFLTNPDLKPKAPFSELIRKTIAQNPRALKLSFLCRPKWKLSDEMKNFGAFINSADTSFSLQGLSRYNYLASRPLQPSHKALFVKGAPRLGGPVATVIVRIATVPVALVWTNTGIDSWPFTTPSKAIPLVILGRWTNSETPSTRCDTLPPPSKPSLAMSTVVSLRTYKRFVQT
ncbi:hypothetical protein F5878DRAFT_648147, partial [Lentinula raphanica]